MCGILFFYNIDKQKLYDDIISGLNEIKNRGRDSCGILFYQDNKNNKLIKRFGKLSLILNKKINDIINDYSQCKVIMCHNRYITHNNSKDSQSEFTKWNEVLNNNKSILDKNLKNMYDQTHPIYINKKENKLYLVHNGNVKIANKLKEKLSIDNIISDTDTGIISEYIYKYLNIKPLEEILKNIIINIDGAYSIILMCDENIYIIRDSLGMRPLSIAKKGNNICICSESSLFDKINYSFLREVYPGEIIKISNNKLYSLGIYNYHNNINFFKSSCSFEYIYLLNNNSIFNGIYAKEARYYFGYNLWNQENTHFVNYVKKNISDFVISYIPRTAQYSSEGYSDNSKIELINFIKPSEKSQRTFIISDEFDRINSLYNKFYFENIPKKKKLILIDDSIVRGNTLSSVLSRLKNLNHFEEIHVRSTSPHIRYEDYMGINIPTREELISNYTFNKKMYIYILHTENDTLNIINEMLLSEYKIKNINDMRNISIYSVIPKIRNILGEMSNIVLSNNSIIILTEKEKDISSFVNIKFYKYEINSYFFVYEIYEFIDRLSYSILLDIVKSKNIITYNPNKSSNDDLCNIFNVKSIDFLSINNLKSTLSLLSKSNNDNLLKNNWCTSWSDNNYPIEFENKWEYFSDKTSELQ